MTQTLTDINPVLLSCQPLDTSGGTMQLMYEGTPLGEKLVVELYQLASTTLSIADFEHEGKRCRVNAFTIGPDGTLTPWTRVENAVHSPALSAGDSDTALDVLVVPVDYEPVDPAPGELEGYTPTTWDFQTCVTVRKKGSKPIP